MLTGGPRCHVDHGWLPLVLPASARRFRAVDDAYRETLSDAGAQLVDDGADVEIASLEELRGDAPYVVVPLDAGLPEGGPRWERAARRAAGYGALRARAATVARELRRRGYRVRIHTWDLDRAFGSGDAEPIRPRRTLDFLHSYAVVTGARVEPGPTLVDAAHAQAGFEPSRMPLVARVVVSAGPAGLLRVAVGPARRQIESQLAGLGALREAAPPAELADRISWVTGDGRVGVARWTVERRLEGDPAPSPLPGPIVRDALDFLVELHGLDGPHGNGGSVERDGEVVARARPQHADAIRRLAAAAERALASVPRGFGHGDFWTGNLLTSDGRLAGVVDWDAAGPGRLPLLDLMHLWLNADERLRPEAWGAAIADRLVPWARAGGDELARAYVERLGLALSPEQLEALVVAYWLDRVAYQVALYDDIAASDLWLEQNVDVVVQTLDRWRAPSAPVRLERIGLDDVRDEWRDLAAASRNIFATPEWVETWAAHTDEQLELRAAFEGDRLAAILPLTLWRERPLRVVRYAGHGPADRLAPACAPEDRGVAVEALRLAFEELDADVFVGEQTPRDEAWGARLGARRVTTAGSPIIRFDGSSWDELLASRSRNFREQVRRRERKLLRDHGATYRLSVGADTVDEDFDVLLRLHEAHWGSSSTFLAATPFHREFAHTAAERRWARFWFVEREGRAIAAWYGFRFGGVECYYQAGRDPEWEHASVGGVLLAHTIRAALEDGAREYWFLRGGESYKYRWATADPGLETWGLADSRVSASVLAAARVGRRLRVR
jgi:CelD/BcsL family acetyltransferase involved in cellulose biosynthesis